MRVEIDQSGKVEQLDTGTAVAFANGSRAGLFISAGEKRIVVSLLKKHPLYFQDFAPVFFAVLIYLLIKDKGLTSLLIDQEYTGKEKTIEEILVKLFQGKKSPLIQFGLIGKLAPVHLFVWKVHRAKNRNLVVKKVTAREILKLLQ